MITGGMDCTCPILGLRRPSLDITEVIDLSTKTSHISGNLKTQRQNHGMSVMKIGNAFKLIAFGGESEEDNGLLDSIEVWDSRSETWNKSELKLEDKVSRFSTTTAFCGLSPEHFSHQANNVPEDNQSQNIQSTIPLAFPKTDEEYKKWYSYYLLVFRIWLMAFLTMAIIPYQVQLLAGSLLLFDLLLQSIYCSISDLQKHYVYLIRVPELFQRIVSKSIKYLNVSLNNYLISWINMTIYEISIPMFYSIMNQVPESNRDEYYEKLMEWCGQWSYHVELRHELALHATLLIIMLSYGNIAALLNYIHKCPTRNKNIEEIVRFLTHPILTLPYLCLLLFLEYYTNFLLNCWILYTFFINSRNVYHLDEWKVLCSIGVFQSIFWCSPLPFMSLLSITACEKSEL